MKIVKDLQDMAWVVFHGINWKGEIKHFAIRCLEKKVPGTSKFLDEMKYYLDVSNCKNSTEYISQAIKTNFGRGLIAQAMCKTK